VEAYPGLFEKAAALLHSLLLNHPFIDGNKRTAWLSTAVFLAANGAGLLEIDQDEAYKLVMGVAAGAIHEVDEIARRLQALRDAAA
jgi:death-on-curing protein